jgi:L-ascorbate metabolism protein UlaG (beta-lactamase superfamily)
VSHSGSFGSGQRIRLLVVVLSLLAIVISALTSCKEEGDADVTPNGSGGQTGETGEGRNVSLTWLGHATFLITSPSGVRVLTDPYPGNLGYGNRRFAADIVTVSHEHFDHNSVASVDGDPTIMRGLDPGGTWAAPSVQTVGDVTVTSIPGVYHDGQGGSKRGSNALFMIETAGLRLLHAGDIGAALPAEVVQAIGRVDVLLVPVGGIFTVDGPAAAQMAGTLGARITIPMHYRTQGIADWQISDEKPFIQGQSGVKRIGRCRVFFQVADLPSGPEIWVLDPAPGEGGS